MITDADIGKHVEYILGLEKKTKTSDALYFTDHKRLSGVYWAICSLCMLRRLPALPAAPIIEYTMSCYDEEEAAFAGNTDQDTQILYTLSGLQILAIYDALDRVEADAIASAVARLQNEDGSFAGDKWGEVDTRFTYCAILALSILDRLDAINLGSAVEFVLSCQNFDGGFGCIPGAESHAGQVFCCVGALTLAGALHRLDESSRDRLGLWLCERQLPCGGFNGRPDKLEDVCYSWWVLSSLAMLGQTDFIDGKRLREFILECQDLDEGGIADRPGDVADVFHTFFGLGGLSLLGDTALDRISPSYALPQDVVNRLQQNRNKQ